ncbi:MAG: hypothetical protein JNJ54_09560 [Myxococcaceae bacterium]|nr:hypothetical protein [Myxococcaceae bacterium]
MKRLAPALAVLLVGAAAPANGRPDCARNCATVQKTFEKQCKEAATKDPQAKAGCDVVLKQFEQACRQSCASGTKPKKPTNTSNF